MAKGNLGFTLAEVLLTLLIVGIVAALTIPALLIQVEKNKCTTSFLETYSQLSQATNLIKSDLNGSFSGNIGNDSNELMNIYSSKLNFSKTCLATEGTGICFHNGESSFKNLDGSPGMFEGINNQARAVLSNGTLIAFSYWNGNCNGNQYSVDSQGKTCGKIIFDINGFKDPNTRGRDIFEAYMTENGLILNGATGTTSYLDWNNFCNSSSAGDPIWNGTACGARIVIDGGMKY